MTIEGLPSFVAITGTSHVKTGEDMVNDANSFNAAILRNNPSVVEALESDRATSALKVCCGYIISVYSACMIERTIA